MIIPFISLLLHAHCGIGITWICRRLQSERNHVDVFLESLISWSSRHMFDRSTLTFVFNRAQAPTRDYSRIKWRHAMPRPSLRLKPINLAEHVPDRVWESRHLWRSIPSIPEEIEIARVIFVLNCIRSRRLNKSVCN